MRLHIQDEQAGRNCRQIEHGTFVTKDLSEAQGYGPYDGLNSPDFLPD